jgi:hypothetical protein
MDMNRRKLITGIGVSLLAAPAIVRYSSLMPVRGIIVPVSNDVTVAGIPRTALLSVADGEYRINGGAWTSLPSRVSPGDIISIRGTTTVTLGS